MSLAQKLSPKAQRKQDKIDPNIAKLTVSGWSPMPHFSSRFFMIQLKTGFGTCQLLGTVGKI